MITAILSSPVLAFAGQPNKSEGKGEKGKTGISFENDKAKAIYDRVLDKAYNEEGENALKELFKFAAKLDDNPILSEEEAIKTETRLKSEDMGRGKSLGYVRYDAAEVEGTFILLKREKIRKEEKKIQERIEKMDTCPDGSPLNISMKKLFDKMNEAEYCSAFTLRELALQTREYGFEIRAFSKPLDGHSSQVLVRVLDPSLSELVFYDTDIRAMSCGLEGKKEYLPDTTHTVVDNKGKPKWRELSFQIPEGTKDAIRFVKTDKNIELVLINISVQIKDHKPKNLVVGFFRLINELY